LGNPAKCDKTPLVHMLIQHAASCSIDRRSSPFAHFLSYLQIKTEGGGNKRGLIMMSVLQYYCTSTSDHHTNHDHHFGIGLNTDKDMVCRQRKLEKLQY